MSIIRATLVGTGWDHTNYIVYEDVEEWIEEELPAVTARVEPKVPSAPAQAKSKEMKSQNIMNFFAKKK